MFKKTNKKFLIQDMRIATKLLVNKQSIMKINKKLLYILFFLWIQIASAQTSGYYKNEVIGQLHNLTEIHECEDCYYLEEMILFNTKINIQIPVTAQNEKIEILYKYNLIEKENETILEFSSVYTGDFFLIYFMKFENEIYINKLLRFQRSIYKKELAPDDFDYLPATEICKLDSIIKIKDVLPMLDFLNSNFDNCLQCPLEVSIDECIENENKKYEW